MRISVKHIYTSYSLDAYIGGNRLSPYQSLRFAQGEEMLPEHTGKKVQLKRPLDSAVVTDHAEYIGEMQTVMNPFLVARKHRFYALI